MNAAVALRFGVLPFLLAATLNSTAAQAGKRPSVVDEVVETAQLCVGLGDDPAGAAKRVAAAGWKADERKVMGGNYFDLFGGTQPYTKNGQMMFFTPPGGTRDANCQFELKLKAQLDMNLAITRLSESLGAKAQQKSNMFTWDRVSDQIALVIKGERAATVLLVVKKKADK